MNTADFYYIIPLLSVTALACITLVFEIIFKGKTGIIFWLSMLGILFCAGMTIAYFDVSGTAFNEMVRVNRFTNFFNLVFLLAAFITILFSKSYLEKDKYNFGEYYILLLFSVVGMMLMVSAENLMILFLGIEIMSVAFYILAGFFRRNPKSNEASLKYFLLGCFATGFLLYGMALVYGSAGSTNLSQIFKNIAILKTQTLFIIGTGLIVIGLSFKIAAFPFHAYAPDVYEGAPTTISGFMSTAGKAAAFGAFLVIAFTTFNNGIEKIKDIIIFISILSMIIGNLTAIVQKNIKRMLAYSSIAHAGYMLIGIASNNILGYSGILFYLLVYSLMQIGAFAVVSIIEKGEEENLNLQDYYGLGYTKPALAVFMSIFMLSLAGIPPFGGFFGKYYIFMAAIDAGMTWLAIVGALASVVAVYFYINVIVAMYFRESSEKVDYKISLLDKMTLGLVSILILFLGIFPGTVLSILNGIF
jgi:NADH-quinone oxidoreductase subunit N